MRTPDCNDRIQMAYLAQQARRATGAARCVLTVAGDGRVSAIGAGFDPESPAAVAEVAMDLLRSAASMLPTGMTVQISTDEGVIDIDGGNVTDIIREHVDPAVWQ